MKYKAEIDVMPLEALLDPQGKAVSSSMGNLGLSEITGVRIGKHISLFVDANSEDVAKTKVEDACKKLLANEIIEHYSFTISQVN
jgi:phosphoribosylformylglycinamidine synthase subunit PurS